MHADYIEILNVYMFDLFCFMHADYIEILNVYMFDLFSSRAILLHSYFCKICVLRRIKTLLYYVFVMDSLYCSLYKAGVF